MFFVCKNPPYLLFIRVSIQFWWLLFRFFSYIVALFLLLLLLSFSPSAVVVRLLNVAWKRSTVYIKYYTPVQQLFSFEVCLYLLLNWMQTRKNNQILYFIDFFHFSGLLRHLMGFLLSFFFLNPCSIIYMRKLNWIMTLWYTSLSTHV